MAENIWYSPWGSDWLTSWQHNFFRRTHHWLGHEQHLLDWYEAGHYRSSNSRWSLEVDNYIKRPRFTESVGLGPKFGVCKRARKIKGANQKDCIISNYYTIPSNIYPFKVKKKNRKRCEVCSKLKLKKAEQRYWRSSGDFIVNFQHIWLLFLVLLLLIFELVNVCWDMSWEWEIWENYHTFVPLVPRPPKNILKPCKGVRKNILEFCFVYTGVSEQSLYWGKSYRRWYRTINEIKVLEYNCFLDYDELLSGKEVLFWGMQS